MYIHFFLKSIQYDGIRDVYNLFNREFIEKKVYTAYINVYFRDNNLFEEFCIFKHNS